VTVRPWVDISDRSPSFRIASKLCCSSGCCVEQPAATAVANKAAASQRLGRRWPISANLDDDTLLSTGSMTNVFMGAPRQRGTACRNDRRGNGSEGSPSGPQNSVTCFCGNRYFVARLGSNKRTDGE